MLTIAERGSDALAGEGRLTVAGAAALKAEARARAEDGTFFGHIAYVSTVARRR
jgi:hypothetical protein